MLDLNSLQVKKAYYLNALSDLKDKDIYGDLLRECHKKDIGVTAYFNASLSHALADVHRDWNVVKTITVVALKHVDCAKKFGYIRKKFKKLLMQSMMKNSI